MRLFRNLLLRAQGLLWRSRAETDLDDELRDYVARQAEQHMATGLSADQARVAALRDIGGLEQLKEGCRDIRRAGWLEDTIRDFAFGVRTLWHASGFAITAVLALALCMGASTAIFTVVNAVLFRPLSFPEQNRLVFLTEGMPALGFPVIQFACPDYLILRARARSFEATAAYENAQYEISGAGKPRQATGSRTTASLFDVLRVRPALGRTFTREEDEDARLRVVLTNAFAQSLFGSAEQAVGKVLHIDRKPYEVIGVMPASFSFPCRTRFDDKPADFFVPISWGKRDREELMNNFNYSTIARLRPNVSIAQARSELKVLISHLPETYPAQNKVFLKTMPHFRLESDVTLLREEVTGNVEKPLLVLLAAVGIVLLIGCADVANLVFSRMIGRQREFAVRAALGASTGRLIRQSLAEGLILSLSGGILGFGCAFLGLPVLLRLAPGDLPRRNEISLDGHVVLFTLIIVLLTPLVSQLLPMVYLLSSAITDRLRESGRSGMQGKQQRFFMSVSVVTQFSLAFTLLAGAGLLIRSFLKATESNPGFQADHLISLPLNLPETGYQKQDEVRAFYRDLLAAVDRLPGVRNAGAISNMPMYYTGNGTLTPAGRGEHTERAHLLMCFGNALETLHTPLLRGRLLGPGDDSAKETRVVISETLANRSWPGENPIGRQIKEGTLDTSSPWMTVVGVVKDIREKQSNSSPNPALFIPSALNEMYLILRTPSDAGGLANAIRQAVHRLDPSLPVENLQTVKHYLDDSLAPERFRTFLLTSFAAIALLLSVVGIAGLLSYSTAQRKQEFGVRLALGATRPDLVGIVFRQGLQLSFAGIAIGLIASALVTRALSTFLYETSPYDPLTFVGVPSLLALFALGASAWPAWSTSRVDPASALKAD